MGRHQRIPHAHIEEGPLALAVNRKGREIPPRVLAELSCLIPPPEVLDGLLGELKEPSSLLTSTYPRSETIAARRSLSVLCRWWICPPNMQDWECATLKGEPQPQSVGAACNGSW